MSSEQSKTKIVVIGGTGLIGSKVVTGLIDDGFDSVPASPTSGVDTLTGEGLAEALKGAAVVVDVTNAPSFEEKAVMDFFTKSTTNLLKYEQEAGVKHHVILSVVGTQRLADSGSSYMRAKVAQEKLVKESSIPYSIVHATQFFEFIKGIADAATEGDTVRLARVRFRPMAAGDVADLSTAIAENEPLGGAIDLAGPEQFYFDDAVRQVLKAFNDPRSVVADAAAPYFGAELSETSLVPAGAARFGETTLETWLHAPANQASGAKA